MRDDWIEVKLGNICVINPRKPIADDDLLVSFIPMKSVSEENGVYKIDSTKKYSEVKKGYTGFIEGDVIFAKITPCMENGKVALLTQLNNKTGFGSTEFHVIRPPSGLNGKYLFHFVVQRDFRSNAKRNMTGSAGQLRVPKSFLADSTIPLPPLPEQRAIVAKIEQLFSDLDNGISNLKEAKEKLSIYRQSVLKKAFEGELTRQWRSKQTDLPTADDLLQQIKEERQRHYDQQLEEWKQAVEEWEENRKEGKKPGKPKKPRLLPPLGEKEKGSLYHLPNKWFYDYLFYAGEMGRGKSKHRPRNDKQLFGGIYPFIQTGDVKAQKIITKYSQTYNKAGLAQSKLWPKGTLCITIAANIAETSFLGIDACFPDSIVGFTPFSGIFKSKYIEYFFRAAKSSIEAYAPATAQKNINLTTLENLVIPFCSIQEQTQIVQEIESRLSVCDKLEQSINNSLTQAETLRQSILKRAFDGKLLTESELTACRQEPDWEPAENLLKRINQEK